MVDIIAYTFHSDFPHEDLRIRAISELVQTAFVGKGTDFIRALP